MGSPGAELPRTPLCLPGGEHTCSTLKLRETRTAIADQEQEMTTAMESYQSNKNAYLDQGGKEERVNPFTQIQKFHPHPQVTLKNACKIFLMLIP